MIRAPRFAPALVACLIALAVTPPAQAGLLPVSVSINPEAENFRWTYAIVLPTDSQLRSGDYFTVFDFGGLISGGNEQPTGWTLSTNLSGPAFPGADPRDDPTIANLSWTYSGPDVPTGQIGLGNFWAISQFGETDDSFFTARTHTTADGRIDTNITETIVPVPGPPVPPELVPEPTTIALAAMGLPLVGLARVLRRRK